MQNSALRDIALLADTLSTHGMDDQQIQTVSRIRYVAHECLRDQVVNPLVVVEPQNEDAKRSRGKEKVRRKSVAKRRRKDDPEQCNTVGLSLQSRLNAVSCQAELYHTGSIVVDHAQLCLPASEIDDVHLSHHLDRKVDEIEVCGMANDVDDSEFHHTAEELESAELLDGTGEDNQQEPYTGSDAVQRTSLESADDVARQVEAH